MASNRETDVLTDAGALLATDHFEISRKGLPFKTDAAHIAAAVAEAVQTDANVAALDEAQSFTQEQTFKGITLKQGANGRVGTFVANGVTPVVVGNTSIDATDAVIISLNTPGGTVGALPHLATLTPGVGFTVVGTAADTSTYNYAIIKNAA